jgi:uncharacterized damage-inducible protein DinB
MPATTAEILQELNQEAATTRRVLERVPADRLTWKPHGKSMSLGQLAMHVALSPGMITQWAVDDTFAVDGSIQDAPQPASTAAVLAAHDEGLKQAASALAAIGDAGLGRMWQMTAGGNTIMSMPKGALVRTLTLNHLYHHRGQLSVYLRLLDVPVPSIYGPSADENPMAAATA